MGEILNLIQQISETNEEKTQKKLVQSIIDDIVGKMMKNAKEKKYHWVADDKTRPYFQEIYNFFTDEGFKIDNYKTLVEENGKIKQERSFDIIWK